VAALVIFHSKRHAAALGRISPASASPVVRKPGGDLLAIPYVRQELSRRNSDAAT